MDTSRGPRDGRSSRRRPAQTFLVLAVGLILMTGKTAHAASFSWNVASGDWFTPGNWNPSGPPGAGDDAVISNGGTATLNAAASITNFTLSSGTLAGTGTLDVSGAMSWTGGRLTIGTTNANGGLSLDGALNKELFGGTLNVNSAATWTGTGNIVYNSSNPLLSIAASGTLDIQTDADFAGNGGAAFMTISNAGTFQKSAGAGTTEVGFALSFNNTGAVDVQTGTLVLRGSGTSSGSFDSTGATLTFNPSVGSETITLTAAASMTGGTVTFSGVNGTTVNHAGSYAVGTTNVTSGAVNLTGPGATLGTTVLSGAGTLNVSTSTASTASSLTLGGGRGGSGTLDVSGAITWNSGTLSGGITNANGGLSLGGALDKQLFGGTLNVNSAATWTGTGNIVYNSSNPLLSIAASGTLDIQTDADFAGNGGAAFMTISNAGTFQKSAGAGTTEVGFSLIFNNTGTMQALTGTLTLPPNGSYTQTSGVTRLNGGSITKSGSSMSIQGGTLEGFGTLTGNVNNSGGTLSPGLSPAQLNETGAYTQGAGGAYNTEIGGLTVGTEYDRAAITGAATLAGTLNITLINGFEPNVGDTFTIMTFGSRSGDFTTVNGTSIPNGKVFQKTVSGSSVVLQVVTTSTTTTTSTSSTTSSTTSTTSSTSSTSTSTSSTTSSTSSTSTSTTTSTSIPTCSSSPLGGCVAPSRGIVLVKETVPGKEKFKAVLKQLVPTVIQSQFGDPVTGTTAYNICLYDDTATLIADLLVARAGDMCGVPPSPCWKAISTSGYKYLDKATASDGVQKLIGKGGGPLKGKVVAKAANNAALGQTSLPTGIAAQLLNDTQATVQVVASDGSCFAVTTTNVRRADGVLFKATEP